MPTRLCIERKCPDPATYRGRCQRHARTNDQAINRAGHAIYRTARWANTRRRVLFEQPLCPCGAIATDVDHIKAIEAGGDPWARANLQGLCRGCHATKTNSELRGRG